ncbi:hypothetical protein C5612_04945 [Pseudomonas frederiksbergensis]|uniref:Uncharacterized protein n=1 Tax=Pseudomonas frederiksbergensis TaxID=104087 RepID=A0A2S8HTV1_9PSED|nr:hypothetical protein C5612_04945 [Pseudomonas frederiksbergensis]
MWERACSRRGHPLQRQCCLTHRFREQARSHRGGSPALRFALPDRHCATPPHDPPRNSFHVLDATCSRLAVADYR